jgi:tetratricopeptide (TPR) repeat protein
MKYMRVYFIAGMFAAVTVLSAPFVSSAGFTAAAQNRISGYVFGIDRQPLNDLYVELLDDLYRTIQRTRTSGGGGYGFGGLGSGVFKVRVLTYGTSYEEQEQDVEIQNFSTGTGRTVGFDSQQRDFYLKLKKGATPENTVVFTQEVPAEAKKLYEKAVSDLEKKHQNEGLASLRTAIEQFPRYYDALDRLGTEYIKLAKPEAYQAAAVLFTVAVEVNPRSFSSWYGLGYSHYSLGKKAEALNAIQKAVEVNAYSPDVLILHGTLLRLAQKYKDAEKQLIKARDVSKDSIPQVHWELALLYGNHLKRYADAARELKLFLKGQQDSKDAEKIQKLIQEFENKAAAKS